MKLGVSRYCENLAAGLACIATTMNLSISPPRGAVVAGSVHRKMTGVKRSLRMIDALFLSACAASAH